MATLNPRDVVIVDGVRSAMGKTKNGMYRNCIVTGKQIGRAHV